MNNATNNGLKTKCCYCGLIRTGVEWHHSAEESEALVSHGVCPTCEEKLMAEIEHFFAPSASSVAATATLRPVHRRPVRETVVDAAV